MLELSRIRNGRWEGIVLAEEMPEAEVLYLDRPQPGLEITALEPGKWQLMLPIPAEAITEGVQSFVIHDLKAQADLGSFTLVAGVPLDEDIRAELNLLRAELDMLKRAFRRHCVETGA
jgi:hypothetical protein